MTADYQFKNADGAISKGTEKILITNVEIDNVQKPKTAVWEFKNAPFDQSFWKNFNIIPLIKN